MVRGRVNGVGSGGKDGKVSLGEGELKNHHQQSLRKCQSITDTTINILAIDISTINILSGKMASIICKVSAHH